MKKFIILLIIPVVFSGCGIINKSDTTTLDNTTKNMQFVEKAENNKVQHPAVVKEITNYFSYKKEDIIKKLGTNFEKVDTGPEGTMEGYYYKGLGITFTFDEDGSIFWIDCDNTIDINGAKGGMNFKQIEEYLGKGRIEDGWEETPEHKVWRLNYELYGRQIEFRGFDEEGNYSRLIIF